MQWCFIVQTILGKCLHHIIDGWDNVIILCFQNEKVNRDVVRTSPSLFWPALFRVKTHIQMLNANGNMCYCNEELQSDARVYSQENSSGRRKWAAEWERSKQRAPQGIAVQWWHHSMKLHSAQLDTCHGHFLLSHFYYLMCKYVFTMY